MPGSRPTIKPLALGGRQAIRTLAGIRLGLTERTHTRSVSRWTPRSRADVRDRAAALKDQPHTTLAQLVGVLASGWHRRSISLLQDRSSWLRSLRRTRDGLSRCSPSPAIGPARHRTRSPAADPAVNRRRGRLHPVRPAGRQRHVHARQPPLRARLDDRHLQQPFSGWGEIFGDDVVAAAMIDRLVHHAEIVALKGRSLSVLFLSVKPAVRRRVGVVGGAGRVRADAQPYLGPRSGVAPERRHDG
jgi:IstB-like ATP binding protein